MKGKHMKVGDIVQLKSGGPKMTISEIVLRPSYPVKDIREQMLLDQCPEYLTCKWWDGEKFITERFGLNAVTPA